MRVVDSAAFDPASLLGPDAARTPAMQALWERIVAEDGAIPDATTFPPAEGRALQKRLFERWNADMPAVASVTRLAVPGPAGAPDVACDLIVPPQARPGVIIFLHGGGWAFGDIETHQRFMRVLANEARMRLLGVDYRLAPEAPYPAGLNDGVAAWRWLLAARESDATLRGPTAVAGDSAGANLALALILAEQAEGRPAPDAGLLFYGAFAADIDTPSYLRFAEGFGLTRARMAQFWRWYAPARGAADPLLEPLLVSEAALRRLPPLYLNAAGLDPLLSEDAAMARRLAQAGVRHRFVLHEGVHHGFMQMTAFLPQARAAFPPAVAFLDEALGL